MSPVQARDPLCYTLFDGITERQQHDRADDQEWNQDLKGALRGNQEQCCTDETAERRERQQDPHPATLPDEIASLRKRSAEVARHECHGIRHIGRDRWHTECQEHGK